MGMNNFWYYATDDFTSQLKWDKINSKMLIIDGMSMGAFLLSHLPPDVYQKYEYGGDYPDYAVHVRRFFTNLATFKFKLVVIFDGAAKMKLNKVERLERFTAKRIEKLGKSVSTDKDETAEQFQNSYKWPLAATVMLQVMRDMNITNRQCIQEEADDIIPVLARYYHCPVLTSDSDFLLLDLPGGVIRIEEFMPKFLYDTLPEYFIQCSIYNTDKLYLDFKEQIIQNQLQPLVGPLLGNDYVAKGISERFVTKLQQELMLHWETFKEKINQNLIEFKKTFEKSKYNSMYAIAIEFVEELKNKLEYATNSTDNKNHIASVTKLELEEVSKQFESELKALKSSFKNKLNLALFKTDLRHWMQLHLEDNSKKFENVVQDDRKNAWFYNKVPIVIRWLSEQKSRDDAIKKLDDIYLKLKKINSDKCLRNQRYQGHELHEKIPVLEPTELDDYIKHLKNVQEPFYKCLQSQIDSLPAGLPIDQFFTQMNDQLFNCSLLNEQIADELCQELRNGKICPRFLNILFSQIDYSYPVTYDLDLHLYGLIVDAEVTRIYQDSATILQMKVSPRQTIVNTENPLPALDDIFKMDREEERGNLFDHIVKNACFKRNFDYNVLRESINQIVSKESGNQDALLNMIVALIMCTHNSPTEAIRTKEYSCFIQAMFVTIVCSGYISPQVENIPVFLTFPHQWIKNSFQNKIQNLINSKSFQNGMIYPNIDPKIVHYFDSYQHCFQSLIFLSQILNLHNCFKMDRFVLGLQGSFVHALTTHFISKIKIHEFVLIVDLNSLTEIFGDKFPHVDNLWEKVLGICNKEIRNHFEQKQEQPVKVDMKFKFPNLKNKKQNVVTVKNEPSKDSPSTSNGGFGCGNNRFKQLLPNSDDEID